MHYPSAQRGELAEIQQSECAHGFPNLSTIYMPKMSPVGDVAQLQSIRLLSALLELLVLGHNNQLARSKRKSSRECAGYLFRSLRYWRLGLRSIR